MTPEMIHKSMLGIMKGIGAIEKSKKVEFGGNYKYRGIDQVYFAAHPLMVEHGVYMTSEILERHREERQTAKNGVMIYTQLRMRYWFRAEDGSCVSTEVEGEGMDTADKSSNKAMAIAHKYAILQAFCVPTEEMEDADKGKHDLAPKKALPPAVATPTKADGDGTIRLRVLKAEKRTDKQGKEFYALKTQETLSNGKSMAFCFKPALFAALSVSEGEDCLLVLDPAKADYPTVIDARLIGERIFADGKPKQSLEEELEVTDNDIPF